MMNHNSPHPAGRVADNGQTLHPSIRQILLKDEHATPEIARRELIRKIVMLLRNRHILHPHPSRDDEMIVLNNNHKKVRTIPVDVAAEAAATYHREAEAPDPAAVPLDKGGDGKRVDPHVLCRELGLPAELAERGIGEVLMTAQTAQAILNRNTENRPIRWDSVARFCKLMEEGRWKLITDAIGLDVNGRVVNGQHRLEALTRTCEPQWFLVKINVEPDAFPVIDSGRPRSPADALHIAGFTHCRARAAVIRLIVRAERGHLWIPWRNVESDEVLERARNVEPRLTACIQEGTSYYSRSKQLVNNTSAAFLLWAYDGEHGVAIRAYLEQLAKGFGIEEGSAAGTVRNALVANFRIHPRMPGIVFLALMVRGAEAHIAGEPMPVAKVYGNRGWPSPSVSGWPAQLLPPADRKQSRSEEAEGALA